MPLKHIGTSPTFEVLRCGAFGTSPNFEVLGTMVSIDGGMWCEIDRWVVKGWRTFYSLQSVVKNPKARVDGRLRFLACAVRATMLSGLAPHRHQTLEFRGPFTIGCEFTQSGSCDCERLIHSHVESIS
jgi:hypothetical protein